MTDAELQVERPLDIVHTYHRWLQAFPTPREEATLARSGHILFINWQPTDPAGNPIAWAAIADGSQDAVIAAEGERLAAFQMPIMLSFSHEPEAELGAEGTAAEFAAAFRRVHDDVIAAGASNVVWVWDVEGISTHHWLSMYHQLWPGAAYVDWIAWDPYFRIVQESSVAILPAVGLTLLSMASCTAVPEPSFDVGRIGDRRKSVGIAQQTAVVRSSRHSAVCVSRHKVRGVLRLPESPGQLRLDVIGLSGSCRGIQPSG